MIINLILNDFIFVFKIEKLLNIFGRIHVVSASDFCFVQVLANVVELDWGSLRSLDVSHTPVAEGL